MSRLKAILTGGLPTFLDVGQSFSAAAITEDNLLAQMRARGMRVVVMGDDTWAQLSPASSYTACHPYPAFNVRDLHTVDDGVWQNLMPYLLGTNGTRAAASPAQFGGGSTGSCESRAAPAAGGLAERQEESDRGCNARHTPGSTADTGSRGSTHTGRHASEDVPLCEAALESAATASADPNSEHGLGRVQECRSAPGQSANAVEDLRTDVQSPKLDPSTDWNQDPGCDVRQGTLGCEPRRDPGWDVLIAHYLGVDHAGHTYGGASAEMYDKLAQIDEQISTVAETLLTGAEAGVGPYERTLMLVMGDHGQTMSGDHGGGSDEERDSVLLAFHLGAWRAARDARAAQRNTQTAAPCAADESGSATSSQDAMDPGRLHEGARASAYVKENSGGMAGREASAGGSSSAVVATNVNSAPQLPEAMPQIDLTPTLSLLLGLPIPFGNLGKVNRRLWELGQAGASGLHRRPPQAAAPAAEPASGSVHAAAEWRQEGGVSVEQAAAGYGDCTAAGATADAMTGQAGEAGASRRFKARRFKARRGSYGSALRANALQVHRYLTAYASEGGGLPRAELAACGELLAAAEAAAAAAQADADKVNQPQTCQAGSEKAAKASAHCAKEAHVEDDQAVVEAAKEAGRPLEEALEEEQVAARYAAYLESAAALARRKFTRFDLPAMWGGVGLALGCTALHVWLLGRLAPRRSLLSPLSCTAAAAALLHAVGLFSANWIQGEGRILCGTVAAATVLLWLRAALLSPQAHAPILEKEGTAASGTSCVDGASQLTSAVPVTAAAGSAAEEPTSTQCAQRAQSACLQGKHQRRGQQRAQSLLLVGGRGLWRRQVRLAALAATALGCNLFLQRYSLIDRWGSDPHDKRQLAAAGVAAPAPAAAPAAGSTDAAADATQRGTGLAEGMAGMAWVSLLVETLLPLVLLPVLLEWVRASVETYTADPMPEAAVASHSVRRSKWSYRLLQRVLQVAPYPLIGAWWVLQHLHGPAAPHDLAAAGRAGTRLLLSAATLLAGTLLPSFGGVATATVPQAALYAMGRLAHRQLRLLLSLLRVLRLMLRRLPLQAPALAAAAESAGCALTELGGAVLRTPLRLLLPRAVYCVTATALMQLLLARVLQSARRRRRQRRCRTDGRAADSCSAAGSVRASAARRSTMRTDEGCDPEAVAAAAAAAAAGRHGHAEEVQVLSGEGTERDAPAAVALRDAGHTALCGLTAVVALLLGSRGPAIVLLLWAQGAAVVALLFLGCVRQHRNKAGSRTGCDKHGPGERECTGTGLRGQAVSEAGGRQAHPRVLEPGSAVVFRRIAEAEADAGLAPAAAAGCLLALLGSQAFFLSGHFCEFSGLQYDSPFVGFENMTWAATPLLFALNSLGALMLPAAALPLAAAAAAAAEGTTAATAAPAAEGTTAAAAVALVCFSGSRSAALAAAVLCGAIQRHHVVVWALFAPKLLFEVAFAAATFLTLALASLWV